MRKIKKETWWKSSVVILCALTLLLSVCPIQYADNTRRNVWLASIVQQSLGFFAVVVLCKILKLRIFGKISGWIYILPCLIVAIDNFQFYAYFQGKMQWITFEWVDVCLFVLYCICIGLFEEAVFRGVVFSVIAGYFSKDKEGLIKALVVSSFIFGLAHLFNLFYGAGFLGTLLQVFYTTLTGGLFAFVFIKTKNILVPAFLHAVYNFCGLLFTVQGLGTGAVLDFGTGLIMAIVSVCAGAFVLYSLCKHPENERKELYIRLNLEK